MSVGTPKTGTGYVRNLILVLILFATLALTAVVEGYANRLSLLFVALLVLGFGLSLWLAIRTATARLLALLTLVFFMEYANQTIGIASGLWRHHGTGGQYVFGVIAWLVAACSAQALSTGATIPLLRRLRLRAPRWSNMVLVLGLLAFIPLAADADRASMGLWFWIFFGSVAIVAMIAAKRMPIHVVVGVVLSGWFVGALSEYAGSSSGCWTFPNHPDFPPLYLVLGCWPLEILVQFSVSAFLAGEPLLDEDWLQAPTRASQPGAPSSNRAAAGAENDDVSRSNRQLCIFLVLSSLTYLLAGLAFAIVPDPILALINRLSEWLTPSLPPAPLPGERFWVSLSFSMMMTISALCMLAAASVRRNKGYAFAVMIAKLASTISSLAYFLFFRHHLASLVIVFVDGSLFCLTAFFVLRALQSFFRQQTALRYGRFPPPRSSGPATVVALRGREGEAVQCLDDVLAQTHFFDLLEKRLARSGKTRQSFSVVIKPNFMFMHSKLDPSTYTDPQLVEALVDRIAATGFKNITLVEAQSTYGNYYANREVIKVAEYVGYGLGKNYKIVDLTQEMEAYDYGGRLGKHFVGPTWRDADFRISFAKNKTHVFCNYTLTLKNIYGTLPMQDKLGEYHTKREYDWPTIESLKHFPVHFGLIDAYVSADGQFGVITDPRPPKTCTILGGENLIAVDWVGASKMGLDPDDPLMGRFLPLAMQAFGKPDIQCIGDLSVYPNWKNVSRFFIYSLDLFEEAYDFSNWWFSVLTAQDAFFTFTKKDWPTLLVRKLLAPFKRLLYPHDAL